jgi:hypothetical protein
VQTWFIDMPSNKTLQRTAAPLRSWAVQENLLATVVADQAFPAAVADLVSRQG